MTAVVSAPAPAATLSHRAVTDIDLDLGAIGTFTALKYCATRAFAAADPDSVRVLYGERQLRGLDASSRVYVLRNGDPSGARTLDGCSTSAVIG